MKITIKKAKVYNSGSLHQCSVTATEGLFMCADPALFDTILANIEQTVDVEINGKKIIAITSAPNPEPAQPPVEEPKPTKPNPVKTAAKSTTKAAPKDTPAPAPKSTEVTPITPMEASEESDYEMPSVDNNLEQETEGLTDADKFDPNTLFALLGASEIEVRVGQIYDNYLTLLLYKNARCDQERLDAKYGPMGWQTSYQFLDGKLFCSVSVRNPDTGEWVSKMDVGTPSNTEADKGQASDAFKRACVCWGSGRELYSAPEIKVYADKTQIKKNAKGKLVCYDKFVVKSIGYDEKRRINKLEIYGAYHKDIVFRFSK